MKLLKVNRLLSGLLSLALLTSLTAPVFAYNSEGSNSEDLSKGEDLKQETATEYYDGISGESSVETDVYVSRSSTFTALVPKTIILSGDKGYGEYIVGVRGDVLEEDSITIEPDSYELTLYKKGDNSSTVAASIEQEDTAVYGSNIEEKVWAVMDGSISADNLKAGSWSAKMQFNIILNEDGTPKHSHELVYVPAKEATEQEEGNIEYWYCPDCDEYYADSNGYVELGESQVSIPKLEHVHSLTHYPAVAPTEEQEGSIEYWYCSGCDKYFADANGETEISELSIEIPKLEHVHVVQHFAPIAPTDTKAGTIEYWYCEACDKYYADEAMTEEITESDIYVYGCANFTVDDSNRYKIGYTDDTTDLVIPATFYDEEDGAWYKVTEIGYSAFDSCWMLESVIIPSSVTSIGEYAFYGCTNLISINIPDGITVIETSTFCDCENLKSINIPDSVTTIGEYAFEFCCSLTSIVIPDSVTYIGYSAFCYCWGLESIIIPNSVTYIDRFAFYGCYGLESVVIGTSVTVIDSQAFYECTNLKSINIPSSVTEIGNSAFAECTSLTELRVPNSVTSIDMNAFWAVPKVIYNGSAVDEYGNNWGAISLSKT